MPNGLPSSDPDEQKDGAIQIPVVPEYQLIKCIGKGGFGTVWLAKNILGTFRAVKVIHRRSFDKNTPYEREFQGVTKFENISDSDSNLLNILHVGRNDSQEYFYYVMELGDDVQTGRKIEVDSYVPKTLSGELSLKGSFTVEKCAEIGISIAEGLSQLHKEGLIHRDIKTSNVVFVNGVPKLADIGLVTQEKSTQDPSDRTIIGTPNWMPGPDWDGWGTSAVDIHGVGKLLYTMCFGKGIESFPEIPTDIAKQPNASELLAINRVICKACAIDSNDRYSSILELRDDLRQLQKEVSTKRNRFSLRSLFGGKPKCPQVAKPRRKRRQLTIFLKITFNLLLVGLFLIPVVLFVLQNFVKARTASQQNACIANLKQLEGAKATWALEHKKNQSDVPSDSDLFGSSKYIRTKPVCPSDGEYKLNSVGEKPSCSLTSEGHAL